MLCLSWFFGRSRSLSLAVVLSFPLTLALYYCRFPILFHSCYHSLLQVNARLEQTSDTDVLQALRSQTHQLVTAAAGDKDVQAVLEASCQQLANSNSYSAVEQKKIVSGWKDVNSKIQQKKETRLGRRLSNAALILQQEGAAGHEFAHRNEVIQLSLCTSHAFSRCVSL